MIGVSSRKHLRESQLPGMRRQPCYAQSPLQRISKQSISDSRDCARLSERGSGNAP